MKANNLIKTNNFASLLSTAIQAIQIFIISLLILKTKRSNKYKL